MALSKTVKTSLVLHWNDLGLALSHQYHDINSEIAENVCKQLHLTFNNMITISSHVFLMKTIPAKNPAILDAKLIIADGLTIDCLVIIQVSCLLLTWLNFNHSMDK